MIFFKCFSWKDHTAVPFSRELSLAKQELSPTGKNSTPCSKQFPGAQKAGLFTSNWNQLCGSVCIPELLVGLGKGGLCRDYNLAFYYFPVLFSFFHVTFPRNTPSKYLNKNSLLRFWVMSKKYPLIYYWENLKKNSNKKTQGLLGNIRLTFLPKVAPC